MKDTLKAISFVAPQQKPLYYTGKAGQEWVSTDPQEAFYGYSDQGVQFVGNKLMLQCAPLLPGRTLQAHSRT